MNNYRKLGKLDGKAVYFHPDEGLGIEEDNRYLREMTEDEESRFLGQRLQFLGEYDYRLSKGGRR